MNKKNEVCNNGIVLTAGSLYLDIDAYACMVAMTELLRLKGKNAVAYSNAPCNYSVCSFLKEEGLVADSLPLDTSFHAPSYIIVDVSDPEFLKMHVPLESVIAIYDHHTGFEDYWKNRIGGKAHIEFIGAAATLIYREWKKCGMEDKITPSTARLLVAAILDNTLNLSSSNTTAEDKDAFCELCQKADVGEEWCAAYFEEVQRSIESDLRNSLFSDIKQIQNHEVLPSEMAQICIWDAEKLLKKLPEIRKWFDDKDWMINIIDIKRHCGYFVCDNRKCQEKLEKIFDVRFSEGVAGLSVPYLRKEIMRKIQQTLI